MWLSPILARASLRSKMASCIWSRQLGPTVRVRFAAQRNVQCDKCVNHTTLPGNSGLVSVPRWAYLTGFLETILQVKREPRSSSPRRSARLRSGDNDVFAPNENYSVHPRSMLMIAYLHSEETAVKPKLPSFSCRPVAGGRAPRASHGAFTHLTTLFSTAARHVKCKKKGMRWACNVVSRSFSKYPISFYDLPICVSSPSQPSARLPLQQTEA